MLPQGNPDSFSQYYEFEGLCFHPEVGLLVRLKDRNRYSMRPKETAFLLALLSKPNQAVTYAELRQIAWPESQELKTLLPTLRETKRTVDKLRADITKSDREIIETVLRVGYRLTSTVTVTHSLEEKIPLKQSQTSGNHHITKSDSTQAAQPNHDAEIARLPTESARWASLDENTLENLDRVIATSKWHLLVASLIYSFLFAVALPLEISYEWGRFGIPALKLIPFIVLWIFGTSAVALAIDWVWTSRGRRVALVISFSIFLTAASLLYGLLSQFLPPYPITQSRIQSLTAQGAYLKNVGMYFLPLAIVFLILPFHEIASLVRQVRRSDSDLRHTHLGSMQTSLDDLTIIRPKTLGVLLLVAGIASLGLTFHLLDNLKVGQFMNHFTVLAMLRLILYFGLGLECLVWFAYSFNEIKRIMPPRVIQEAS